MKNYQTIKISAHPDHYYPLKLLNTRTLILHDHDHLIPLVAVESLGVCD